MAETLSRILITTTALSGTAASPALTSLVQRLVGWRRSGNTRLGGGMARGYSKITGVIDVDQRLLVPTVERLTKESGGTPKRYRDFRELLKEEYPDICIVATPDHWHPLITIEALKHGAHVYVEKPISHTNKEGRAMVNAARKYLR